MNQLEAAHDYIRRGWHVVPLHGWDDDNNTCRCKAAKLCVEKSRGKHPSTGNQWQKRPLTSGADVEAWYEEHPNDNVGILTGPESGIFVLDVDGAAGIQSITDFAHEYGPLPATRIVRTGSGGLHYFFRHPGHFNVHNSTSWLAPGIDIRGVGGQVVAPPSVSARGPYELIADNTVADPQDWLLDRLREHSEHVEHGRTAVVKAAEPVDSALMPEKVRTARSTIVEADQGRFRQFHSIVAACREAGYTQGQTVTIAAPWCATVNKFVGRVEAEVARCWGKLEAEDAKVNEWLPGAAPAPEQLVTGTAALAPAPTPKPVAEDTDEQLLLTPSWAPVDLEPILTGTYEPEIPTLFPRADGNCLVYQGRVHSFHGESESGKSLVVQAECARLVGDGHDVLYLDFESDASAVVGRLLDLQTTTHDIRSHFTYIRPDNDPRNFVEEREHYAHILGTPYTLIVIDGMTDALGTFGAGSTDNDEIADFMRKFVRQLARSTGAAVIIIDHVTKDADSRGRWAVGGQAKMNALDGSAYMVEVVDALGRGLVGTVSLRVAKDRPGGVRPHCGQYRKLDRSQEAARITVDSTGGRIRTVVQAPHHTVDTDPKAAKTFRPTVYMSRVSEFLSSAAEPVTLNSILTAITGKERTVKQAVAILIAEGFVSVSDGPRKSTLHKFEKAYDPDLDPESDTFIGWAENDPETTDAPLTPPLTPGQVSDCRPTPPPPTGGAAVNGRRESLTDAPPSPAAGNLNCNECGDEHPADHIQAFRGLCSSCARDN